jgi:nuclear pore complex protein Nup54
MEKWDPASPNCVFRHYFYNKVDESKAPYYRPGAYEDTKSWEEALSKKPGPGYIPVLCTGFTQMGERIKIQQRNLATFNQRLHDINNSLEAMLSKHDLVISVRALDAKRKHMMLKQRCLALATKVQVLRNRGYAMGGDEEDLKIKLQTLEKGVCDPGLSARAEEIWARMVGVRERARILKEEMGKRANENGDGLDEETVRRAEKVCRTNCPQYPRTPANPPQILEDYGKQLGHVKRELASVSEDLKEWEKDQAPQVNGR